MERLEEGLNMVRARWMNLNRDQMSFLNEAVGDSKKSKRVFSCAIVPAMPYGVRGWSGLLGFRGNLHMCLYKDYHSSALILPGAFCFTIM